MNKIKVVLDSSAPNCEAVKKVLEDKGLEVTTYQTHFDFNEEIMKQINELKAFESLYFQKPQSEKMSNKKVLLNKDNVKKSGTKKLKF